MSLSSKFKRVTKMNMMAMSTRRVKMRLAKNLKNSLVAW